MSSAQERLGVPDLDVADASHRSEVTEEAIEPVGLVSTQQREVAVEFPNPRRRPALGEPVPQRCQDFNELVEGVIKCLPFEMRCRIHE